MIESSYKVQSLYKSKEFMSNSILSQMTTLGGRLREERVRLGLNQTDFAALGGVQRDAQLKYETDKRIPDALYFGALFAAGIDIQYVIAGVKSSNALTSDENELLDSYRTLDIRGKAGMLGMAEGLKSSPPAKNQNVIQGKVGQTVQGDQHVNAPMTFNMGSKRPKK